MLGGEGLRAGHEVGGSALEHDGSAVAPGTRTHVDDPVGVGHDRLMVLDDDERVTGIHEPVHEPEQGLDVGEVQARRGFVEHVDRTLLGHRDRELEALPFAAGERIERLPEGQVAEAHVGHAAEDRLRGPFRDERGRLVDRHRQHLGDVLAVEGVVEHVVAEPRPLAQLAPRLDALREAEVRDDDPETLARGARALGVRAEQARFDPVRLRERLADVVEDAGVGRRARPARPLDRRLVDDDHVVAVEVPVDERGLSRPRDAGDDGEDAEGHIHVDVAQIVQARAADLAHPRALAGGRLQRRAVVEMAAGDRVGGAEPRDVALVCDAPARAARARAEVDDVVGDRDHFGLVFDDEHGVALVAQQEQQFVHALDVVRMQPRRRLVEHVGHVGEARPEMADHLRALRLAARERAARPVEREVAEADVDERVERLLQRLQERADARVVDGPHPGGEIRDLHRRGIRDVHPVDPRRTRPAVEPCSAACRARHELHGAVDERAHVRLQTVTVFLQHRLGHLRHEAFVGHVDARDLHLGRLFVEQVVQLLLGVVGDRQVGVDEARLGVALHHPPVRRVAGHLDRPAAQRQRPVEQFVDVDVAHLAEALALRAHAARDLERAALLLALVRTGRDGDGPRARDRRHVERERLRRADVRLADATEQQPQHGVHVGRGADGRTGVGAHAFLIDDDRGADVLERIDLGAAELAHELLDEGRVGLVDEPLRLVRDRAEHETRLARAAHPGEHRQAALGDLDVDALQVVLARPDHADHFVRVGGVSGGRVRRRCGCHGDSLPLRGPRAQ